MQQILNDDTNKTQTVSNVGKILVGVTGGFAVTLTLICAPFISPAFRRFCLPYVPATDQQVKNIFAALNGRKGTLIDLGSGDGRIVIEGARRNFQSHGVELNIWLVLYSKIDSIIKGCWGNTKFFRRDLWKFPLNAYDNIVIFGVDQMMSDIEIKLLKECKPGSNIIACRFPLPNKKPVRVVGAGIDTVWVYAQT